MHKGTLTLSGDWTGVYDYADTPDEAVPFTAALTDVGGVVWGTTQEPNTFSQAVSHDLHATVSGVRSGPEVRFRKVYDGRAENHEPIIYSGHLSPDGNRIEGRWRIASGTASFHGPFVMNRLPGARTETALHLRATIEV